MALTGSARSTKWACIHKKGMTEAQAVEYLVTNGFITQEKMTPTQRRQTIKIAPSSITSSASAPPLLPKTTPPPEQLPTLNDSEIDPSFKRLIQYKHYAHKHGVDVPENVVLTFLDKTDQLTKQEQEVISYDDLYQGIEKHLAALAVKYTPKEESILTAPLP